MTSNEDVSSTPTKLMRSDELRRIVNVRRRRYRRPLVILRLFLIALPILFALPLILSENLNADPVETIGILAAICGLSTLGYFFMALFVNADVSVTDVQLSDIEQGKYLAHWPGMSINSDVFIGQYGLIYDNQYTPWHGSWDFSLTNVEFDSGSPKLKFNFLLETKAGVKRTKVIEVPVPRDEKELAQKIAVELTPPNSEE